MRVLHIGLSSIKGGIESCILDYARALREQGIIFDYVDVYGDGLACSDEIAELGGVIYTLPNYKRHYIESKNKLKKLIADNCYRCIHVNMLSTASLMSVQVARELGIVPIVHSHNAGTVGAVRKLLHAVNSRRMAKMNAVRIACSKKAGCWMFGGESFEILPNSIRTDKYAFDADSRKDIRQLLNVTDDATVLGFVGRLESQKNPLYLVDILSALKKLKDKVKLVVVGDGTLKEAMSEHAKLKGVADDVHFAGVQKDPSAWYSAFDAFLLPSLYEGFPIVSVEAQTAGLPCFISDRVTREVSLTDNVCYCELTEDAENWAREIISHPPETECRKRCAEVIGKTEFSITEASLKLLRIYESMNGDL